MATPTSWQQSTEAVYGPFTDEEHAEFVNWLAQELAPQYGETWRPRVASFPLQSPPNK